MKADLVGGLLQYLVDLVDKRVLTGPRGAVRKDLFEPGGRAKVLRPKGGMMAAGLARLVLSERPGNPYAGREDLLDLALLAGDRLVIDHARIGTPGHSKPDHFFIYPLAALYELAAGHAGARRRAAWRGTMARNLAAVEALIDRCPDALGRPHPWAGTGPNHYFGWLGVAYRQAKVLGDSKLAGRIEKSMLRQLDLQTPDGYFPEHRGPACLYQTVSLDGVAMFHHQRPLPQTARALEKGVGFLVRAMYPDGRVLDTFDERNRLYAPLGCGAYLAWTPEGRTLLARNLARRPALRGAGAPAEAYGLGAVHRTLEQTETAVAKSAATKPLPADAASFRWTIEGRGLVRKAGPWFYALAGWTDPAVLDNPYFLQRTQLLSIYHERAGVIVGGGNDKHSPLNTTLCLIESDNCFYSPPRDGRIEAGRKPRLLTGAETCDRLMLDFGAAVGTIEVAAESPRRLRLAAEVTSHMFDHEVWLTLQLPLNAPVSLRAGSTSLRLAARDGQEAASIPLGTTLEFPGKWRMKLPRGSQLLWPHFPWASYSPPKFRAGPAGAVPLVRIPLPTPTGRAEVSIEID